MGFGSSQLPIALICPFPCIDHRNLTVEVYLGWIRRLDCTLALSFRGKKIATTVIDYNCRRVTAVRERAGARTSTVNQLSTIASETKRHSPAHQQCRGFSWLSAVSHLLDRLAAAALYVS